MWSPPPPSCGGQLPSLPSLKSGPDFNAAVYTGARELEFSLVQFMCCEQSLMAARGRTVTCCPLRITLSIST